MENSNNYKNSNCANNETVRGVFEFNLNHLLRKRLGGSLNINGIVFQCKYALLKVLTFLNDSSNADSFQNSYIRLEGIEDIDLHAITLAGTTGDNYIQVKSTKQKLDASTFWNMKVLQNFLEAYSENKNSTFTLVHCTSFAKGHMQNLIKFVLHGQKMPSDTFEYWRTKIHTYLTEINISDDSMDILHFFQQLQFEKISEAELNHANEKAFIQSFDENNGNEKCYLTSLLWSILDWSRERKLVSKNDINSVIENVREDIAKGAINPAIHGRWLERIRFQTNPAQTLGYFEGKAARPQHIAAGLPVRRSEWELKIIKSIDNTDVFLIRASSGQGKSTLAWQTAHSLEQQGWSIYELLYCRDKGAIGSLITYIESRLKIGEIPLIVIDGLSDSVSEWAEFISRANSLPVKFLITSREEDWYRYGMDGAEVRLEHINLSMSDTEAEQIFDQFRKRNAIHASINSWQPAWEKVKDRGLLMEFVYLITEGEMIEQRLSYQVRKLADDKDGSVKLDILRLISIADVCGAKIETQKLLERIKSKLPYNCDLGECLCSIKNEYYIDITSTRYVEGLHPVRSAHLMKRLHETISIENTSKELLLLIGSEYLSQYCSEVVLVLRDREVEEFITAAAKLTSERNFTDITEIVEGLFKTDILGNWTENKQFYDYFFKNGLGIFVAEAFPWSGIKPLEEMHSFVSGPIKENVGKHLEMIRRITPFEPNQSTTYAFLKALSFQIASRALNDDCKGIGRLWLWYIQFKLDCTLFDKISTAILWRTFKELNVKELGFLFCAAYKRIPQTLSEFYALHQTDIISELKIWTNSVTILPVQKDLLIEYFTDFDEEQNLNDESMKRIEAIMPILPFYQKYSTQALRPPIPGIEEILTHDPSVMHLPRENLPDSFQVYMNILFRKRIEQCYEEFSNYEWQQRWFGLRKASVKLTEKLIGFLEEILRVGLKNMKLPAARFVVQFQEWEESLFPHRSFPGKIAIVDAELLQEKANEVSTWIRSLKSIFENSALIILPEKPGNALLISDLREILHSISNMQGAYQFIIERTTCYCNTQSVEQEELYWYHRLYRTVVYILDNKRLIGKVQTPEIDIKIWCERYERKLINSLEDFALRINTQYGIECITPSYTFLHKSLRIAMIGINGMATYQEDPLKLYLVRIELRELVDLDIDVYIIVPIKDRRVDEPVGVSMTRVLLKEIKDINDSETMGAKLKNITPWSLQSAWLNSLPNVYFVEPKTDAKSNAILSLLIVLWEITETRNKLSLKNNNENEWLSRLEKSHREKARLFLGYIRDQYQNEVYMRYESLAKSVLDQKSELSRNEFQDLFLQDISK